MSIARLLERTTIAESRFPSKDAAFGKGPLERNLGNSMASILSNSAGAVRGNVGSTYVGALFAGRFLNAKTQQAIQEAQYKVLFDRQKAKALYAALETPPGKPVSEEVLAQLFGTTKSGLKSFVEDLFEVGKISSIMARGAAIGTMAAQSEKEQREKPMQDSDFN